MIYLLKTEPTAYSFADLVREKETDWTGVTNPQAVKNLRAMKKGDKLVIYHTGRRKGGGGPGPRQGCRFIGSQGSVGSHRGRAGHQAAKNPGGNQAAAAL